MMSGVVAPNGLVVGLSTLNGSPHLPALALQIIGRRSQSIGPLIQINAPIPVPVPSISQNARGHKLHKAHRPSVGTHHRHGILLENLQQRAQFLGGPTRSSLHAQGLGGQGVEHEKITRMDAESSFGGDDAGQYLPVHPILLLNQGQNFLFFLQELLAPSQDLGLEEDASIAFIGHHFFGGPCEFFQHRLVDGRSRIPEGGSQQIHPDFLGAQLPQECPQSRPVLGRGQGE